MTVYVLIAITYFAGAVRTLKRDGFIENGRIDVTFVDGSGSGEGSVDSGGPSREFLRLCLQQVMSASIFSGAETGKYLTKCS